MCDPQRIFAFSAVVPKTEPNMLLYSVEIRSFFVSDLKSFVLLLIELFAIASLNQPFT